MIKKRWFWLIIGLLIGWFMVGLYTRYVTIPKVQNTTEKITRDEIAQSSQKKQATKKSSKKSELDEDTKNNASDPTATKITDLLNYNNFVGTALVVKNNKVYYQHGFGYADKDRSIKNTAASKFQIASIQKSITGALFMKEVINKGKAKLSDPVSKYYPNIKDGNKISLRSMLNMNSGLKASDAPKTLLSNKELVEYAASRVNVENIGNFSYQPVNYLLIAGIIEKVTGKSYKSLVEKDYFQKYKLTNMGFMDNFYQQNDYTLAYSNDDPYNFYSDVVHQSKVASNNELGTGNIYATAADLFRIEQVITQGKFIPQSSVDILRDTTDGKYGGGVYNYKDYFSSHGIEAGYNAGLTMTKDGKTGVILLANRMPTTATMLLSQQIYQVIKTSQTTDSVKSAT